MFSRLWSCAHLNQSALSSSCNRIRIATCVPFTSSTGRRILTPTLGGGGYRKTASEHLYFCGVIFDARVKYSVRSAVELSGKLITRVPAAIASSSSIDMSGTKPIDNGVRNLLDVSKEEKRRFVDSFDHILTDCDGTVWQLVGKIEGVGDAITRLQKRGKKMVFVTNNSLRSDDEYRTKFAQSGITANVEDIIHPALAAIHYLQRQKFKGLIYTIGSPVFRQTIADAGYQTIEGPSKFVDEEFPSLWRAVKDDEPVRAVALDTDFNLTTAKLIRAQLYLTQRPDCLFLVGTTDMMLTVGSARIIGPGPFYKLVEEAIGRPAIVVGKPGRALRDIVVNRYGLTEPRRVLFVGDMLEQDVGFGNACGFQSLLVLTGSTTLEALQTHRLNAELPAYYLESFADFSKVLDELEE